MDFLFWGLMLIPFGFAIAASAYESVVAGAVSIILGAIFFYIFADYNPFPWIVANPGSTAIYVVLYFLAGAVYSVLKWVYVVNTSTDVIKADFER